MSKSVSIVAMGHSFSRYLADFESGYGRPTDAVWGINSAGVWLQDVDMIIALDNFRRDLRADDGKHVKYVNNILNRGVPVMTDVEDPEWPQTVAYPLRRVLDNIWPQAKGDQDIFPMLMNTVNYAVALALADGYESIRLYGCDFRLNDSGAIMMKEIDAHRDKPYWWPYHMPGVVKARRDLEPGEPTTCFLLGVAHARNVNVQIASGSTLCDSDRSFYYYGYEIQPRPYDEPL